MRGFDLIEMYWLLYWLFFGADAIWHFCGDICFGVVVCCLRQLFLATLFHYFLDCFQWILWRSFCLFQPSSWSHIALKITCWVKFFVFRGFPFSLMTPLSLISLLGELVCRDICRVGLILILIIFEKNCFCLFDCPCCAVVIDSKDACCCS